MVFIVGRGSLQHALEKIPASLHNQIVGFYLVILGQSFNSNDAKPRKTVQHYFERFLYYHSIIMVWHDDTNISVNMYCSNNYISLSEDNFVVILSFWSANERKLAPLNFVIAPKLRKKLRI